MTTRHLTAIALLASALVLTACGNGGSAASDTAKGNDADIAFLVGMTPHHEQAVEMSEMVLAADPPPTVVAIAQQVKDAQAPEIEQMKKMLVDLGETPADVAHSGGHDAGMAGHGGMMSDEDMDALMKATGARAARLYLEGMIKHHQGAIDAAETEITDGEYEPAIALAKEIKTAQAAEIIEMRQLLTSL